MSISKLYEYLMTNGVSENNRVLIKNQLKEIEAGVFGKGYSTALQDVQRRKKIIHARRSTAVKRFLDYLSDITHGTK